MATPKMIDLEKLCQPIAGDRPQGEDLREDRSPTSPYSTLKDARNGARAAERARMFDEDSSGETLALWKPILDQAPGIIAERSKDLEIISWTIEALVRLKGFAGLRDGFALARAIVENFWDTLYPEPDEDGLETKVGPLTGLNGDGGDGTLLMPIRNTAITSEGPHGEFSFWQYQQAQDAAKITDDKQRSERTSALGFSLDIINATIAGSSEQFYVNLIDDIQGALDEYRALNDLLRQHCGQEAPPSSNIVNLLDEALRAVRFLTKDKLAHLNVPAADEQQPTDGAGATATTTGGQQQPLAAGSGPIDNREEALRRLQDVANYFRTYEPHTPLAASIDRVVKWGRMSISELMMELVPDNTARAVFTQLTGVKLDGTATDTYVPPPAPAASRATTSSSDSGWGGAAAEEDPLSF